MSDDEDDPFENLDVSEDREGDPFERLGDPDGTATGDEDPSPPGDDGASGTPPAGDEPTADVDPDAGGTEPAPRDDDPVFEEEFIDEDDPFATGPGQSPAGGGPAEGVGPTDDGPLGGDDPFDGMAGREGDPFGEGESVFESVDVESVDADEVWETLESEPSTATAEESRYVEVSKHRFCEQCEHFSSPPNAHCTHEEAEIIEYLDMETVRLLNCPVVAEQRELEDEG